MKHTVTILILTALCSIGSASAQSSAVSSKPLEVNFSVQEYLNNYVTPKVEEWEAKGRYESSSEYVARVNEQTRDALIKKLSDEALTLLKQRIAQGVDWKHLTLGDYDPDNQTLQIKSAQFGEILLKVPAKEAEAFEKGFASVQKINPDFYFTTNGEVKLNQLTFKTTSGASYVYNSTDPKRFEKVVVNTNFSKINVDFSGEAERKQDTGGEKTITVGKSDVAIPPATNIKNSKTFAVIIANENYQNESQVLFAKNDGETFKQYCIKTLGLPEENVSMRTNATLNNIRTEINWLSNVANKFNGEANIIFFYAGHGIPDESSRTSYLLPVDGSGSDVMSGYKLDDLYKTLGKLPAKSILVFMDACFSGAQRSGEMMASARGVAIKSTPGEPVGNMIVFSAAQGDETAYPYRDKGHGMFTYFLLKKLKETKGAITLGELGDYISDQVGKQSIITNRKSQTPTVNPSYIMADEWRRMKLPGF
ncbi:MAG: caspase family protein [Bacteroidales bacterium]|nr:caspase family protein [Bacteroidales bacterium]